MVKAKKNRKMARSRKGRPSSASRSAERPRPGRKVLVIGLDCADPDLIFRVLRDRLPNIKMMMEKGIFGNLRSVIPPITIPAWLCMATGRDPGALGLYGFRHRKGKSYDGYWIANSTTSNSPAVWDLVGRVGKRSTVIGFPPSFPPRPINGRMVSCFITPDASAEYTYPPELKKEVEALTGGYIFDITFRSDKKEDIRKELWEMTRTHLVTAEHLVKKKDWDLFWYVEIGTDRLHHAFWKYFDPRHTKYSPGHEYASVIPDYYRMLDDALGRILRALSDDTVVLVVSDHGAKPMEGVVAVNEWLINEGYLVLREPPAGPGTKLENADIDWERTRAWGWGGYYARIFFNVKGRESSGVIRPEDLEAEKAELRKRLEAMKGPDGGPLKTKVFVPEEIYDECKGDVPDLMVFFGDLAWRSAGTIGWGQTFLTDNDTGPDDAMHDWEGIIIAYDPRRKLGKRIDTASLLDITPTILGLMGVPRPKGLKGRPIKELMA
jgi:predicted AlkP superfamily phosphohydrolase/phosphomutase